MELLEDFLRVCGLRGRTKRTIEGYKSVVSEYLTMFPEPELVTNNELELYLSELQKRGLRIKTLKTYFSAVSSFYEYLMFKEIVTHNPVLPFRKWYLDKPDKSDRRRLLSVREMRLLINSIPLDDIVALTIMIFLAKTGARREEFLNVLAHDVDIKNGIVKLPPAEKRHNRFIPMDAELQVVMEVYLDWWQRNVRDGCPYLWINSVGHHMHEDTPNQIIAEYAIPLGLHEPGGPLERRLTCHCFRKFFTHHLTKNGIPDIFLQILRGDSLKDAAWKDNYLEPDDLTYEIRMSYYMAVPQLVCY